MYQIENLGKLLKSRRAASASWPAVSRNVVFLGLTSLFTDISSEMVSTVLPLYLVFALGMAPLQFGIIDGLYQGASALVRLAAGITADRWRRYKEVALAGYALSAVCKPALILAGSAWPVIAAIIALDRAGKGIRTSPRDALISLSSPPQRLGTAFGVHRALDTCGAMLGPLAAFGVLALAPGAFDTVFVVSFCAALLGLSLLALFVENRPPAGAPPQTAVSLKAAAGLLGKPGFRGLVLAGALLSLATVSDSFLYIGLQRRLQLDAHFFPLLYVGTALVYMLLAAPVGRLADGIGRKTVFVGGYTLLLIAYLALMLLPPVLPSLFVYVVLLGLFYAATDGVLMALASTALPAGLRTSGLALLTTATALARLLSSVLFGLLWTWLDVQGAVLLFSAALATALVATVGMLYRAQGIEP